MTTKTISMKEALSFGWAAFKGRAGFFVGLLALVGVISVVPQALVDRIDTPALAIPFRIILQLLQWFLLIGLLRISLKFIDNESVAIPDLFSGKQAFVSYALATILYGLIGLAGILLLVIPGIYWLIVFGFYSYLVVDKGQKPMDSLKGSAALTKGARWQLFLFGLLVGVINLAGALVLFVGLFVTVPVTLVATAHVYRQLLSQGGASA